MRVKNPVVKSSLQSRLKRIEGQVRGLQTMIEDERDCREIMQQFSAIRSAMHSASQAFVEEYATECLVDLEQTPVEKRERLLRDMVSLLSKAD